MNGSWQKIAVTVIGGLLFAGVIGVWNMSVDVATISTNVDILVQSVADHEIRIRAVERR